MNTKDLKIALIHDFLIYPGGAEKVLEVLCEMFPEAPIYTLLYDEKATRGLFRGREVKTSFLQKFPWATSEQFATEEAAGSLAPCGRGTG